MTDTDDPFADLEGDLEEDSPAHSDDASLAEKRDFTEELPNGHRVHDQPSERLDDPAFSFDATKQDPLYVRPETWDEFNDTLLEVELALRNYGIRDVPKRELHDAALQVLTNHSDELMEAVVAARRRPSP